MRQSYCICGENRNTDFVGAARRGTDNVFAKLKTSNLKLKIQAVGRAARILHKALQTSADILPVGVKAVENKIFHHFHIYTVGEEELKEFCDFVCC
jgi:hypothetical protein